MSNKRNFKDLTIRDNFMFAAVMMEDDNCKKFLEMLLEIEIEKIEVSYEKSIIFNPDCKGVRLDVYAKDENNTRYDIEMQVVEQELALRLGDESISIVLSTEGGDFDSIQGGLKAFLEFVKEDNSENNSETEDAYVRQLQKSIRSVKKNRGLERSFMAWIDIRDEIRDEMRDEIKDEVREEVKDEVREDSMREVIMEFLNELGEIPKEIENFILSETRIDVLKNMVKVAATTKSFSDFENKITSL